MARKGNLIRKHDDLDLGLSVSVMIAVLLGSFLILPFAPSLAQTFLIGALVLLAVFVALYDYHT